MELIIFTVLIVAKVLLGAVIAIWLYRKITGTQGPRMDVVGRGQANMVLKLKAQQGYISLARPSRRSAMVTGSIGARSAVRVPWGW
jgi:hypothetical protein